MLNMQTNFLPSNDSLDPSDNSMRMARKIRVNARFSTSEQGEKDVHIRQQDEVSVRMGLRATIDEEIGGE